MGEQTKIDWADHTWSPWWGCSKVSEGCEHCYAEGIDRRFAPKYEHAEVTGCYGPPVAPRSAPHWGKDAPRRFFGDAHWRKPLAWNRKAERDGVRRRVFPSMCDVFEDNDDVHVVRYELWKLIRATPWLDWLLLTKRPGNIGIMLPEELPVWLGVTAENQARADERIPMLLQVPAAVRFVSVEPQLGKVCLRERWVSQLHSDSLDWVICGCESGPKARPFDENWARIHRDVCLASGVPFFFKQTQRDGRLVKMPALDGRVWDQVPTP